MTIDNQDANQEVATPRKSPLDEAFAQYSERMADQPAAKAAESELYAQLLNLAQVQVGGILHRFDPEVAHDVAVDTMLASGRFDGKSQFSTWAFRVVRNAVLMQRRRDSRASPRNLPLNEAQELPNPVALETSHEVYEVEGELVEEEKALLEAMKGQVSMRALARELGLPKTTVQRMVAELRLRLEKRLEVNYSGEAGQ